VQVLVTGSHGFIGSALVKALGRAGHRPVRLVRSDPAPGADEVRWDPNAGTIDAGALEGFDSVVHLAGKPVGPNRWTEQHKAGVLDSRVRGTRLLAETLAGLAHAPVTMVSASGVDFYGSRGNEILTESSSPGTGFMATVTHQWEDSTRPARDAGIRVWCIRSGPVFGGTGGLLPKILIPFRLGIGGKLGSGRQYMPWIILDDHIAAIVHLLTVEGDGGPVNLTAPNPVQNAEFTRVAGAVLNRPTLMSVPETMLRVALGTGMANELVLSSHRVVPEKLQSQGFEFRFPDLEAGLRYVLGKSG
jgi:uncharacterized protein (TIGR01777 family)